ncbi:MAG: hypothetical protein MHM6MM_002468 [Cercozoa sp. M6MM]
MRRNRVGRNNGPFGSMRDVRVRIVLPNGRFLDGKFHPSKSLWHCLDVLERRHGVNLTKVTHEGKYQAPCLEVLASKRRFDGIDTLAKTRVKTVAVAGGTKMQLHFLPTHESIDSVVFPGEEAPVPLSADTIKVMPQHVRTKPKQSDPEHPIERTERLLRALLDTAPDRKQCLSAVRVICRNLLAHPNKDKYRTLSLSNPNLLQRLGDKASVKQFLESLGFRVEAKGSMTVPRGSENANVLRVTSDVLCHTVQWHVHNYSRWSQHHGVESPSDESSNCSIGTIQSTDASLLRRARIETEEARVRKYPDMLIPKSLRQGTTRVYSHIIVRVVDRANQRVYEASFLPQATEHEVWRQLSYLASQLQHADSLFESLRLPPNTTLLREGTRTLLDLGMAPSATVVLQAAPFDLYREVQVDADPIMQVAHGHTETPKTAATAQVDLRRLHQQHAQREARLKHNDDAGSSKSGASATRGASGGSRRPKWLR